MVMMMREVVVMVMTMIVGIFQLWLSHWWPSIPTLLFNFAVSFVTAVLLIPETFSMTYFFHIVSLELLWELLCLFFLQLVVRDSITSFLEQCISIFNLHINYLGPYLEHIVWSPRFGVRSEMLQSDKLSGDGRWWCMTQRLGNRTLLLCSLIL